MSGHDTDTCRYFMDVITVIFFTVIFKSYTGGPARRWKLNFLNCWYSSSGLCYDLLEGHRCGFTIRFIRCHLGRRKRRKRRTTISWYIDLIYVVKLLSFHRIEFSSCCCCCRRRRRFCCLVLIVVVECLLVVVCVLFSIIFSSNIARIKKSEITIVWRCVIDRQKQIELTDRE